MENQPIIDARALVEIQRRVEESKAEDDLARQELSPDEEREVIRRVLRGQYGPDADEKTVDAALDAYFAKRFDFEPPDRPSLLATLYIRRGRIALFTLVPAAVLAIVLGVVGYVERGRMSAAIEAAVAAAGAEAREILRERDTLRDSVRRTAAEGEKLLAGDEAAKLRAAATKAIDDLGRIDAGLVPIAGASREEPATAPVLEEARKRLGAARTSLAAARNEAGALDRTVADARAKARELELRIADAAAGVLEVRDDREKVRKDIEVSLEGVGEAVTAEEAGRLRAAAAEARSKLDGLDPFLARFAPGGRAEASVKAENLLEVRTGLQGAREVLAAGRGAANGIARAVGDARSARRLSESLDASLAGIRAGQPPAALLERAEKLHAMAKASISGRRLDEARAHAADLDGIRAEAAEIVQMGPEIERLRKAIDAIAREDGAKAAAADLAREAAAALAAGGGPRLRESVDRLRGLERELSLEFRLVVTGGIERTWKGNPSAPSHYLVVRAEGPGGAPVRRRIRDEEYDGRAEEVSEWAERVPRAIYERVKADKKRDSRIDEPGNALFGRKERGRLSETVLIEDGGRPVERAGQITSWEK